MNIQKYTNSQKIPMMKKTYGYAIITVVFFMTFTLSCDDFDRFEVPEENSIADATPPEANFVAIQGEGLENDEWKDYTFANGSTGATSYQWNFGDGNTATDFEPVHTFAGEGTYTVSLTIEDNLGAIDTYTEDVVVIEPEQPAVPDPTLINFDFDRLPKSSGSDCCCSAWINRSLGDQGESSSGNGGSNNVVKFDNIEPDHIYQEFEVVPNAEYLVDIEAAFQSLVSGGSMPSMLEIRVLAGSGYDSSYVPVYYTNTVDFPQDGFGYSSLAQAEDPANNIFTTTLSNPSDSSYMTTSFSFNAGTNTSVALFIRGIGGPATGGGGGNFGYNSGDEEMRIDKITVTAIN